MPVICQSVAGFRSHADITCASFTPPAQLPMCSVYIMGPCSCADVALTSAICVNNHVFSCGPRPPLGVQAKMSRAGRQGTATEPAEQEGAEQQPPAKPVATADDPERAKDFMVLLKQLDPPVTPKSRWSKVPSTL